MSQLDELKQIIVGDNSEQLSKLKERVESIDARTRDVAEVLAPAIEASVSESKTLINALETPVSESLKRAIRREPKEYADILYPVMSPAIRRAIATAISSLLTTINQTVESATSVKGMKMRFQSVRTGVPYAELALRKSLLYRVEHVYLIDRETGLLISELKNSDAHSLDSDAVSAMFSAIQSFVQDSFSNNKEDRLTELTVGEHNVWVVHGPRAMLACVIRGRAPSNLREELTDVLDRVRTDYAQEINDFDGDASTFVGIEDHLQPCLQLELIEGAGKKKVSFFTMLLGVAALLGIAYFAFNWVHKQNQIETLGKIVRDTPGYVATELGWADGKLVVQGLKDPYAQIPEGELMSHEIDKQHIDWQMKPYHSLESEILLRRLKQRFAIPDNVKILIEEGDLSLDGMVDFSWLVDNETKIKQSNLFETVETSKLGASSNTLLQYVKGEIGVPEKVSMALNKGALTVTGGVSQDWQEKLEALFAASAQVQKIDYKSHAPDLDEQRKVLLRKINSTILYFSRGMDLAEPSKQVLVSLNNRVQELVQIIRPSEHIVVHLFGQADTTGSSLLNEKLRRDRESRATALLNKHNGRVKVSDGVTNEQSTLYNERSVRVKLQVELLAL